MTVTDVSTTCAVVIFRVKVSCITSVDSLYANVANSSTFESSAWFGESVISQAWFKRRAAAVLSRLERDSSATWFQT